MISAAPANPDLANPDLALPRPAARALRLSSENNELAPGFVPARFALPASPCQLHRGSGKGRGPGQRLRTGVHPVGNGFGLRCLLGARALSRPNPPSSRMSAAAPFGATPSHEGGWMLAPSTMT